MYVKQSDLQKPSHYDGFYDLNKKSKENKCK